MGIETAVLSAEVPCEVMGIFVDKVREYTGMVKAVALLNTMVDELYNSLPQEGGLDIEGNYTRIRDEIDVLSSAIRRLEKEAKQ